MEAQKDTDLEKEGGMRDAEFVSKTELELRNATEKIEKLELEN